MRSSNTHHGNRNASSSAWSSSARAPLRPTCSSATRSSSSTWTAYPCFLPLLLSTWCIPVWYSRVRTAASLPPRYGGGRGGRLRWNPLRCDLLRGNLWRKFRSITGHEIFNWVLVQIRDFGLVARIRLRCNEFVSYVDGKGGYIWSTAGKD